MLTAALIVVAILALGGRLSDGIRLRQEEIILQRLPLGEAHEYYGRLKHRARKVRVLRAITLASLVVILFVVRRRFLPDPAGGPMVVQQALTADKATALAREELDRYAAREHVDAASFRLVDVLTDDRHPFIYEFICDLPPAQMVRVYVGPQGRTKIHRVFATRTPGARESRDSR